MSTIPEIDAVHLGTPMVAHFNGCHCIGIAPGDCFLCVVCGLDFKSGTQCNLHHPKCPGCPNPNRFEADGTRLLTIMEIMDHLAGKDQQCDSGQMFGQFQNTAGFEVQQLNNEAMQHPLRMMMLSRCCLRRTNHHLNHAKCCHSRLHIRLDFTRRLMTRRAPNSNVFRSLPVCLSVIHAHLMEHCSLRIAQCNVWRIILCARTLGGPMHLSGISQR